MPNALNQITAQDYNDLRTKILSVLGTGAASYGYGQVYNSSAVTVASPSERDTAVGIVTAAQWDALRYDLANLRFHQTGINHLASSAPLLVNPNVGDLIGYGATYPLVNYTTLADLSLSERFSLSPSRAEVLPGATTPTFTSSWSDGVYCTFTVNFATAENARLFFNTGSQIRFSFTRTGGSDTAQNAAWTTLLSGLGVASVGGIGIYSLNNTTWYEMYRSSSSALYAGYNNYVKIECKSNVANNSTGTATQIIIKITLVDAYVDYPNQVYAPPDEVNGSLIATATQYHAASLLLEPTSAGNYMTVPSPSSISASVFATI